MPGRVSPTQGATHTKRAVKAVEAAVAVPPWTSPRTPAEVPVPRAPAAVQTLLSRRCHRRLLPPWPSAPARCATPVPRPAQLSRLRTPWTVMTSAGSAPSPRSWTRTFRPRPHPRALKLVRVPPHPRRLLRPRPHSEPLWCRPWPRRKTVTLTGTCSPRCAQLRCHWPPRGIFTCTRRAARALHCKCRRVGLV